jgi:hypothetical protein
LPRHLNPVGVKILLINLKDFKKIETENGTAVTETLLLLLSKQKTNSPIAIKTSI